MEQIVFQGTNNDHPLIVSDLYSLRSLRFTGTSRQSCINLQQPHALQLAYTRWMMSALLFSSPPQHVLLLGLGGGALIHFLLHHHPQLQIDVVEKSKAVIDLARDYFGIPIQTNLRIHHQDAETFYKIKALSNTYDLVLLDIFGADAMALPMYQQEFYNNLCKVLTEKGVIAANLWGSNKEEFSRARTTMLLACNRQILQLKIPEKGNVICLGFKQPLTRKILSRARNTIAPAERQYGLSFNRYWKRLLLENPVFFFRLLMRSHRN